MENQIQILHIDCMEYMKDCADNSFDLAIVDPPYFDGPQKKGYYYGTKQITETGDYKPLKHWKIPGKDYFNELMRVSKNQIIWGINYFNVALPGGRVIWIKANENTPFSQADIAYQSFYNRIDVFECLWAGFWKDAKTKNEKRIHPTQKPIALYEWLLNKYAKPGYKIIDTHLGSGSSAIAAHYSGFDFVGCEIDKDYFIAAQKRFKDETRQIELFA